MGIPLTASLVQPPDPLGQASKIVQLRQMMQQGALYPQMAQAQLEESQGRAQQLKLGNQQQQMQIDATHAMQDAIRSVSQERAQASPDEQDGYDSTLWDRLAVKLAKDPRALPEQIQGMQQFGAKLGQDFATLDKTKLENYTNFHNQIDDEANSLLSIKDPEQQQASFAQKLPTWEQRAAAIDPRFAAMLKQYEHTGPESLQDILAVNGALSHHAETALKTSQAAEADARAKSEGLAYEGGAWWDKSDPKNPKLANVAGMTPDVIKATLDREIDKVTSNPGLAQTAHQGIEGALKQNNIEAANKVVDELRQKQNEIDTEKALAPIKEAQEKEVRLALNGGLTEPQKSELLALGKDSDDYIKMKTNLQQAKANLASAKSGSELANALVPVQTLLGITADSKGVRMNMGLVNGLGPKVGDVARRVQGLWDQASAGKLPPDTLKETGELLDEITAAQYQGYLDKASSRVAQVNMPAGTGGFYDKDGSLITAGDLLKAQQKLHRPDISSVLPGSAAPVKKANRPPLDSLIQ